MSTKIKILTAIALTCYLCAHVGCVSAMRNQDSKSSFSGCGQVFGMVLLNDSEKLKLFFDRGVSLMMKDTDGWTLLHELSASGKLVLIAYAIKKGSPLGVNAKDCYGWTPLHLACRYGYCDVVKFLLRRGGDLKIKNEDQCTPFDLSVGKMSVFLRSLEHVFDRLGKSPFQGASLHKRRMVRLRVAHLFLCDPRALCVYLDKLFAKDDVGRLQLLIDSCNRGFVKKIQFLADSSGLKKNRLTCDEKQKTNTFLKRLALFFPRDFQFLLNDLFKGSHGCTMKALIALGDVELVRYYERLFVQNQFYTALGKASFSDVCFCLRAYPKIN